MSRYQSGSLYDTDEDDVPLLVIEKNSPFINHPNITEFMGEFRSELGEFSANLKRGSFDSALIHLNTSQSAVY